MRRITVEERRARLVVRHRLAPSVAAGSPLEAAEGVVALHATDPASVFLSVRARSAGIAPADVESALYEDRTLVRMLGMRRTLFVVPTAAARLISTACTRAIAQRERRKYAKRIADAGLGDEQWLKMVEAETLAALRALGEATGAELSAQIPLLRSKVLTAPGKAYESNQGITTWVLSLLAADGLIVRGRPRGSWISTQHRWVPAEKWLPTESGETSVEDAQAELARRWLARFGPATAEDLQWWTGWGKGETMRALTAVAPAEVDLGGTSGIVLEDDLEPVAAPPGAVSILPALDPTTMGWRERGWYLGEHSPLLFDRFGNAGPTLWHGGKVIGGWGQRSDGEIAVRLLDDVGAGVTIDVGKEAERLRQWVGDVRFKPRFRNPLERELTAA